MLNSSGQSRHLHPNLIARVTPETADWTNTPMRLYIRNPDHHYARNLKGFWSLMRLRLSSPSRDISSAMMPDLRATYRTIIFPGFTSLLGQLMPAIRTMGKLDVVS